MGSQIPQNFKNEGNFRKLGGGERVDKFLVISTFKALLIDLLIQNLPWQPNEILVFTS